VPKSRKDAWIRDELIVALDLYRREGRNPSPAALEEVSDQLRSIPVEQGWARDPKFRNPTGVYLKVANFVALDPASGTKGMSRGSKLDAEVFSEFWGEPALLEEAAAAIRANLAEAEAGDGSGDDPGLEDAPEGRLLTRVHRVRERNPLLARRKKDQVLKATGRLACEACGFDFYEAYGERGRGFIECHHLVPVRDLRPESRTQVRDLALLCANCHRMVHVKAPWLTLEELRGLLGTMGTAGFEPALSARSRTERRRPAFGQHFTD
jgi:5-methylcytosine-specific restriction protein A